MNKFIYQIDFNDISKELKEHLIDIIIEKRFIRGDYKDLKNDIVPVKSLKDAKEHIFLREEIEMEIPIEISIKF